MVILIFSTFLMVVYCKVKKRTNDIKEIKNLEAEKKQKIYNIITVIVSMLTIVIVLGLLYFTMKIQTKVSINKQTITVSAGFLEGCRYKTENIVEVALKDSIPPASKLVGTSIGNLKRGIFKVEGLGKGHLYIETDKGPYLYIKLKDGFIIINYEDPEKTKGLYRIVTEYKK